MPQIQGVVSAPGNLAAGSTTGSFMQSRQGEIVASELHGRLGVAAYNGNLFMAATAAAGITIPISSATAPTFTLYNPVGSGVNAELLAINIGFAAATTVVSPFLLGFVSGITANLVPTSVTAKAVQNAKLGGAASVTQFYTAATITATTLFITIGSVSATSGAFPNFNVDLMGGVLLTPGSLVHLCGTAAQTSATGVTAWFAEYPV